jgi:TRAP-type C4-dicarboxylate transport system permease small subunit
VTENEDVAGSRGSVGVIDRISAGLAVAGGVMLVLVAALVTASVLRRWLTSYAIPGDFELVQIGVAAVAFSFLPLCQLRHGNIFVDVFTVRAGPRLRSGLDGVWSLVYAAVAGLIAWGMAVGARETIASGTTSMVLGVSFGWVIAVCAVLAAWLALVALVTAVRTLRRSQS